MKYKYYYINEMGNKIFVRESKNEYKYALVYKNAIDNKGTIKLSNNLEAINKEYRYRTLGFGHQFNEKVNGRYLYSSQFEDPNKLKIVEIMKEVC